MIVPKNLIDKYGPFDEDTRRFFDMLELPDHPCTILEVGSHEEYAANILAELGHDVTGIDLREYDSKGHGGHPCNYKYVRSDVNRHKFDANHFDIAFSLSAIEHFGLGTYGEGPISIYADVLAMDNIWKTLKYDGCAYITVPYGGKYVESIPHWRIYDQAALRDRLVGDFMIIDSVFFASAQVKGNLGPELCFQGGELVPKKHADIYEGDPHLTVLAKLLKSPVTRIAPDGR